MVGNMITCPGKCTGRKPLSRVPPKWLLSAVCHRKSAISTPCSIVQDDYETVLVWSQFITCYLFHDWIDTTSSRKDFFNSCTEMYALCCGVSLHFSSECTWCQLCCSLPPYSSNRDLSFRVYILYSSHFFPAPTVHLITS